MPFELSQALSGKKIGLVLCGGGFKGAYQIGVWKALVENGVKKFDVIAGTSVGALNALLIANNNMTAAERLWLETDFMRWDLRGIGFYLAGYTLLFGPIVGGFAAFVAAPIAWWLDGSTDVAGALTETWAFMAIASFFMGGVVRLRALDSNPFFFIWPITFQLICLLVFAVPVLLGGTAVYLFYAIYGLPELPLLVLRESWFGWTWWAVVPFGIACGWLGTTSLTIAQRDAHIFGNHDIIENIEDNLDLQKLRDNVQSLFVTLAEARTGLYPFEQNVRFEPSNSINPPSYRIDHENPGISNTWVPRYFDLCTVTDKHQATEILRLSSALPWVFRGGASAGGIIVDGGLADNMPVLPVAQTEVDCIVIILLTPNEGTTRSSLENRIRWLWREQYVSQASDQEIVEMYRKWVHFKYSNPVPNEPGLRGKDILIFAPAKPLVTWRFLPFLTGTLNFSRMARRNWLQLGYRETLQRLSGSDPQVT